MVYLGVKEVAYHEIATSTFEHLHSLSVQWHLSKRTGTVARAMDRGISSAATVVDWLFLRFVPTILEGIIMMILFIVLYSAVFPALALLVGFTVYMLLTWRMSEWRRRIRHRLNRTDNHASAVYVDSLTNFEVVKAFTNEPYELARYSDAIRKYQRATRQTQASLGMLNSSQQFIVRSTQLAIYVLAGSQVVNGDATVGDFVALTAFTSVLFGPLEFLGMVFSLVTNAYADLQNLADLQRERPDVQDAPGVPDLQLEVAPAGASPPTVGDSHGQGSTTGAALHTARVTSYKPPSIEFRNVFFRYPGQADTLLEQRANSRQHEDKEGKAELVARKGGAGGVLQDVHKGAVAKSVSAADASDVPVAVQGPAGGSGSSEDDATAPIRQYILNDVSFTVAAGTTTAIVGTTGSGKSTIAKLLFRFYDVTSGSVLINGQRTNGEAEVSSVSVRQAIGLIPQDTVLFHDTVGYNVAYGRPDAPSSLVAQAVSDAALDGFIAQLPAGLDTKVGERGLRVSGGERQRIAIARVLLKDAPVLVADEATSALDSVTESKVQTAINRAQHGRTVVVIAHRLSTIKEAHQILVLHHGRIVERGSHEALLEQGGRYAALWQQQAHTQQEEGEAAIEAAGSTDGDAGTTAVDAAL